MATLAEVKTLLGRYVGANLDANTRINLACERLLKSGNWRGTKTPVVFQAYPDCVNGSLITLPRSLNTILAGVYLSCQTPIPIRNSWYSFLPGGARDYNCGSGFVPVEGRYTTFALWNNEALRLRIKTETSEANGSIIFRGVSNNATIYSSFGGVWSEGVSLAISNNATTTQTFDSPPYAVIKPVTHGRVYLYTVDDTNTETLVAVYDPNETAIAYRRYRTPSGCAGTDAVYYLCICKRAYVPLASDNDEVVPSNLGALRMGLEALRKEDAEDYARADQLWEKAAQLLVNESEDDTGASAENYIIINDDYHMAETANTL